jgi:hypothetical protein
MICFIFFPQRPTACACYFCEKDHYSTESPPSPTIPHMSSPRSPPSLTTAHHITQPGTCMLIRQCVSYKSEAVLCHTKGYYNCNFVLVLSVPLGHTGVCAVSHRGLCCVPQGSVLCPTGVCAVSHRGLCRVCTLSGCA